MEVCCWANGELWVIYQWSDCSNHHNKTVGSEVGMHGRKVAYLKHVYLLVCQIRFFSVRSAFCEKLVRF